MLIDYFKKTWNIETSGQVIWAHAVNSLEKLEESLSDPAVMMIETDISISGENQIIAAHPPKKESDLTINILIEQIKESKKGLKLDFKDPATFSPTLEILRSINLSIPIILNADVLTGNGGWKSPFNPTEFIKTAKQKYPQGMLSLGWTTKPDPAFVYTSENIDEMLGLVGDLSEVTFPVRASLLPTSWDQLSRLLQKHGRTLSIYNNEPMDQDLIDWIAQNTDPAKCFYDFTDENKNPIRLW